VILPPFSIPWHSYCLSCRGFCCYSFFAGNLILPLVFLFCFHHRFCRRCCYCLRRCRCCFCCCCSCHYWRCCQTQTRPQDTRDGKKHSDEIWTNFFPLPRLFNSFYPEQQFQLLADVISSCHGNRGRLAPQQLIEHTSSYSS